MKYSEFNTSVPKLFLGQVAGEANGSFDIQYQLKAKDAEGVETVLEQGVARTIRVALDEIDVEADGQANNIMLDRGHKYLVKKGFVPDTTGLGPKL
jgi:hypothetical protein